MDNNAKQIIWFLEPKDDRGVAFLKIEHDKKEDEMRMWLPAFKKVRRISAKKKGDAFMGSDLSYEDLSSRDLDENEYERHDDEKWENREFFVLKTIQKIDKVAREKFQDTFDKIKINFSKLFELFFEGGTASLTLVGDPDPLESDITILAQPPGKKNQSLRMLSAGEKSLTAIALLFAIYQYKPSPYCILDEVDAPLDDVNIQKFKKVLNKFSDDTQFIVVTHNKLTMEIADYLYGVTMEQKGVSKLVSVKFDGEA